MQLAARRIFPIAVVTALLAGCATHPPTEQRYPIYFQKWSAQLDDSAKDVVASAAQVAAKEPKLRVNVLGYADPDGSPQANKDLSALRAQVVADQLTADGIAKERITRQAIGEVNFTLDSLESRRVEIVVVPN